MKKAIGLILSLLMLLGIFAACGGNGNNIDSVSDADGSITDSTGDDSNDNEDNASSAMDYSEHETFSLWLYSTPTDYYSSYSDNPVVQYLNKKFNVTLNFEQPSGGTEQDSLSLMFGTGEYTDMIELSYYSGSVEQLYADGVIIDIAEYLDYMPNYKKMLESDAMFKKHAYSIDGQILSLKINYTDDRVVWGGLVYRRDILETMTGGNVFFPSGNDEPTTIEDFEYMLPLYKQYFEAAGMTNSAPLIIPYNGYFPQGQLSNGFGVAPMYYQENGEVHFGAIEDGFYNYLKKMNEWYEEGYIYQDFASRSNDMFYFPNPELTYGGAAGIWFGMPIQLGDKLSLPEYGLEMDVVPMTDPLDTDNGVEKAYVYSLGDKADNGGGYAVSSKCENVPKLLSIIDYLYSEEGSMLTNYGLTAEQGAADDPIMAQLGLENGVYAMENDSFVRSELLGEDTTIDAGQISGSRLCGLYNNTYQNQNATKEEADGGKVWGTYVSNEQGPLPMALSMPVEDSKKYQDNNVKILDYINSMTPKFIMGTTPLNEDTWNDFVTQLKAYGVEENIEIMQNAYNSFLNR